MQINVGNGGKNLGRTIGFSGQGGSDMWAGGGDSAHRGRAAKEKDADMGVSRSVYGSCGGGGVYGADGMSLGGTVFSNLR